MGQAKISRKDSAPTGLPLQGAWLRGVLLVACLLGVGGCRLALELPDRDGPATQAQATMADGSALVDDPTQGAAGAKAPFVEAAVGDAEEVARHPAWNEASAAEGRNDALDPAWDEAAASATGAGATGNVGNAGPEGSAKTVEPVGYRKPLTIPVAQVTATLTDFPVLVRLTSDADLRARARADGLDLVFKDATGTAVLAFERESWDKARGDLRAWVKLPSVSSDAPTVFYLYYGDDNAFERGDEAAVWSNGFDMVWHLDEVPAATAFADSTSPANNSTAITGITSADSVPAVVGNGVDFDGGNDYIDFGSAGFAEGVNAGTALTVSAWVRHDTNNVWDPIIAKGSNGHTWFVGTYGGDLHSDLVVEATNGSVFQRGHTTTGASSDGAFHHVTMVYDGSGATEAAKLQGYVDAVPQALTYDAAIPTSFDTQGGPLHVGCLPWFSSDYCIDGVVDEVHVSTTPRSAAWIKAEHDNQKADSTFLTAGVQESVPAR